MAILKKRQDAGAPAVTSRVAKQTSGTRPSQIMASAPAPTAKPKINSGAPTSITNKVSGAARPTVSGEGASGSASGSTLGKTLTSALAGAGLGMGAKFVYDKLTGKPAVVPKTTPATKPTTGGTKPTTGGTKPTVPTIPTKPTKPIGTGKTPVTPKAPVTPKNPTTPTKPTGGGTTGGTAGGVAYDDDGNLMPGYELDENGDPVWVGLPSDDPTGVDTGEVVNDDGSTTYTYDDGSTVTVDENGNVISMTDPTDELGAGSTDEVVNDDGSITYTYDDGSTATFDADGNFISQTDAEGEETGASADESYGYFEDEYGNIYDNDGNLVYSVDESYGANQDTWEDEYGNTYDWDGNLVSEADHSDYVYTDDYGNEYDWDGNLIYEAPVEDVYEEDPYYSEDEYYEEPVYEEDTSWEDWKKGGFVTLMKDGGVPKFEDGGVVDTEMFDDGSYTDYYEDGSYITYDSDGAVYEVSGDMAESDYDATTLDTGTEDVVDPTETERYSEGNIQYFDDGSYIQTFDDGSTITVDSDGNIAGSTEAPDYSVTGAGSGTVRDIYNKVTQTPAEIAKQKASELLQQKQQKSALDTIKEAVGGSGYLGAGAAGAVLGALLSDSNLFGGNSNQKPRIDMSKVGVINPRTTDFGVGPATYVPYADYTAREQQPDLYGNELYENLNAPGFNPVEEGDYGYEEAPAQQNMAEGGLPSAPRVDYYTFGKPVDPISNLTNPRPIQQMTTPSGLQGAMQSMTQQQSPQGIGVAAPQAMGAGMRKGGLPEWSEVPVTSGRLDFRQGSAVHGAGDGQSDDIPAMLADGEYVIDAETVAQIGNGSTKAGAQALDKFRENIRSHKRSAPVNKIPPKTKALTSYLKKGK